MRKFAAEKNCNGCNRVLQRACFWKARSRGEGLQSKCKDCLNSKRRKQYLENREERKKKQNAYYHAMPESVKKVRGQKSHLQKKYGMTLAQYEYIYRRQYGACAVCKEINIDGVRLAVDHCHKTGQIRGLLCRNCNLAIGYVKESFEVIQSMHDYLELWGRISGVPV